MSDYRNFIQDFPSRCKDLLKYNKKTAVKRGREVTLLLMATTAGFVMPLERLNWGTNIIQPDLDRPKYEDAMEKTKEVLTETIGKSELFGNLIRSWRCGEMDPDLPGRLLENFPFYSQCASFPLDDNIASALSIIRHGIAHGNIITKGDTNREINEIVFVCGGRYRKSGKPKPIKFVILTPKQLEDFLMRWFEFLNDLPVPQKDVINIIDTAAS